MKEKKYIKDFMFILSFSILFFSYFEGNCQSISSHYSSSDIKESKLNENEFYSILLSKQLIIHKLKEVGYSEENINDLLNYLTKDEIKEFSNQLERFGIGKGETARQITFWAGIIGLALITYVIIVSVK